MNSILNAKSPIAIGLVLTLLLVSASAVSYSVAMNSKLGEHVANDSIHLSKDDRAQFTRHTVLLEKMSEDMGEMKDDLAAMRKEMRR